MRTHHFIDIENLVGKASFTECEVEIAFTAYIEAAGVSQGDLVTVASSHHNWVATSFGIRKLHTARILPAQSGNDGADIALVEAIANTRFEKNKDAISLGSGDHYFALILQKMKQAGIPVRVFGNLGSTSHTLWSASHECQHLYMAKEIA